tara:strand:- start:1615 stop:1950 length:336 start_codon:yes stop_codon:yes gene_type:complete
MFRRIDRLISLPRNIKDIYYSFFPNYSALSLYGNIIPKKIDNSNILISNKEKWEVRDFNIKSSNNKNNNIIKSYKNELIEYNKNKSKNELIEYNKNIPFEKQWEVRDFYVK